MTWRHGFTKIDFYFHMNTVPELSSMAMPNPSALFCLSNAFRSRTLDSRITHTHTSTTKDKRDFALFCIFISLYIKPWWHLAGLVRGFFYGHLPTWQHESSHALKEANIALLSQVTQHFLQNNSSMDEKRGISSEAEISAKNMIISMNHLSN